MNQSNSDHQEQNHLTKHVSVAATQYDTVLEVQT